MIINTVDLDSESDTLIKIFEESHYDTFSIIFDRASHLDEYLAEARFVSPAMKFWDRDPDPNEAVKKLFKRIEEYLKEEQLLIKPSEAPGGVILFVNRSTDCQ